MKLDTIQGLGKLTADRLRRAGVKTVEALALIDVRATKVKDLTEEQLRALRRKAQWTVFSESLKRLQSIADDALDAIEGTLVEATWATIDAAKIAQERASEAIKAAQGRTRTLAAVAATKAKEAATVAEREYGKLEKQLRKAPAARRGPLKGYQQRARRAADAARAAGQSAAEAVRAAERMMRAEVRDAQKKGRGLVHRLRDAAGKR